MRHAYPEACKAAKIARLTKQAETTYPKLAGKFHLHHIVPKFFGGAKNGTLARLPAAYHQLITNEFRSLWEYGQGTPALNKLNEILKQVYRKYPLP